MLSHSLYLTKNFWLRWAKISLGNLKLNWHWQYFTAFILVVWKIFIKRRFITKKFAEIFDVTHVTADEILRTRLAVPHVDPIDLMTRLHSSWGCVEFAWCGLRTTSSTDLDPRAVICRSADYQLQSIHKMRLQTRADCLCKVYRFNYTISALRVFGLSLVLAHSD